MALDLAKFESLIGNIEEAAKYIRYVMNVHYYSEFSAEAMYLMGGYLYNNHFRDMALMVLNRILQDKRNHPYYVESIKLLAKIYRREAQYYSNQLKITDAHKVVTELQKLEAKTIKVKFILDIPDKEMHEHEPKLIISTNTNGVLSTNKLPVSQYAADGMKVDFIFTTRLSSREESIKDQTVSGFKDIILPILGDTKVIIESMEYGRQEFILTEDEKAYQLKKNISLVKLSFLLVQFQGVDPEDKNKKLPVEYYIQSKIGEEIVDEGEIEYTAQVAEFNVPILGISEILAKTEGYFPTKLILTPQLKGNKKVHVINLDKVKKEKKIILYHFNFNERSAEISEDSYNLIEGLKEIMKLYPKMKIEIRGHTDNTLEEKQSQKLSLERATAVSTFLQTFGIDPSRMVPLGYGNSEPIADSTSVEGRPQNNRIEIKVIDM